MTDQNPLESIEEAAAEAAASGHELTPFVKVENGFQATCKLCEMTTWVGHSGIRYSILSDQCEKQPSY
ncbi:MAG: hypothetical protein AAF902_02380 [Chloroflexota bacterium]